jgi:hypothetical protein
MKKFMVSVADVRMYDTSNGNLLAIGKTLLDSNVTMKVANTDIRGGRGAQLQTVYFHSPDLNFVVTDTQWNLDFLSATLGSDIVTGSNVFTEETVTLGAAGAGTIAGTPLAVDGTTIYGWVTLPNGVVEKVVFVGSDFTSSLGTAGDVVCVRYYHLNSSARSVTINADVLPKNVRLELETLLVSSAATTNRIGVVQISVPKAQLTGNFTLTMKLDGVSTTPLDLRATAADNALSAACNNVPTYAKLIEILDSANWYDNLLGLSIEGGDFTLVNPATKQLHVYAIPQNGAPFLAPTTDLTFTSGTVGTATISSTGLVTTVAAGTSLLHVTITAAPQYDAAVTVTVS